MRTRRVANTRAFNPFAFGTYIAFLKYVTLIQGAPEGSEIQKLK
jgi:hypothetical protein